MCPVMNNVLTLVIFLNKTNTIFTINPINNAIITDAARLAFEGSCSIIPLIASSTACNPKYGSITAAFNSNLVFNAARIGLNVVTSPPAPTFNIMYPTVALINPPTASYIFLPKNK